MRFTSFLFLISSYILFHFTYEGNAAGTTGKNSGGVVFKDRDSIATKTEQKCQAYIVEACNRTLQLNPIRNLMKKVNTPGHVLLKRQLNSTISELMKKVNTPARAVLKVNRPDVVGGRDSVDKEYPHMALIGFGDGSDVKWQCGGSIISEQYVLSAAHCSTTSESTARWVRLGELDLNTKKDNADTRDYSISEIITHPEYKSPHMNHDIALFKLNTSVKFNSYIRPICLNMRQDLQFDKVTATGWGSTGYGEKESPKLQTVDFNVQQNQKCEEVYKNNNRLKNGFNATTMICAGYPAGGKDTCQGDSGGPLHVDLPNGCSRIYSQIGITSLGIGCAFPDTPAVYTRVSFYIPWIESIVWK